nr:MAG TPA: hypothetical protein [Caudoviricetes sp.]
MAWSRNKKIFKWLLKFTKLRKPCGIIESEKN